MLKGDLVALRPVEERDLQLIARWRNDPEIRPFFFSPFLINPGGQKKWYERMLADPDRLMLMIETLDGKTVGMLGLDKIDWRNQTCEVGQILLDPSERGQGYAEEAVLLLGDYSFEELNLHRVYGYAFAENPVIEFNKLVGFSVEGVLRQAMFANGKFHDIVVMGMLREDWEAGKS